jgi:hypothetical protein
MSGLQVVQATDAKEVAQGMGAEETFCHPNHKQPMLNPAFCQSVHAQRGQDGEEIRSAAPPFISFAPSAQFSRQIGVRLRFKRLAGTLAPPFVFCVRKQFASIRAIRVKNPGGFAPSRLCVENKSVQRVAGHGRRDHMLPFTLSRKSHFPSPQTRGTFPPSPFSTPLPRRCLAHRFKVSRAYEQSIGKL